MNRTLVGILLLCLLFSLAGCVMPSGQVLPTTLPTSTAWIKPSDPPATPTILPIQPEPTLIPTTTATPNSPSAIYLLPQYQIVAALDYATGLLSISQNIGYSNTSDREISYLALYAEPNRYPETLSLFSIKINGWQQDNYTLNQNILILPLASPLPPQATLQLSFVYSLQLPTMHSDLGNGLFGQSQWQINLLDWYFWLPPYSSDQGWLIHPSAGFAEHTVYPPANFDCYLNVINAPENLVVTGSTDPFKTNNSYHFSHPNARNLSISLSPYFQLVELSDENVTIHSYFFPGHEPAATIALNASYRAVQIYGKTISPYHRQVLNIIETNLIDGLEGDGMYFLGSAFYDNTASTRSLLTLLAVHETAHQWWYAAVSNDQAMEPWLDEAFSTFMESIYYENTSPEDYTWWKGYRLSDNPSSAAVDSTLYTFPYFRPYRNAIYLRGASFLLELRTVMGDDQFFAFLQQYFQRAKSIPTTSAATFFSTLSDFFDIKQTDLLNTYFLPVQPDE